MAELARERARVQALLQRVFQEHPELWSRLLALEAAHVEAMVALDPETTRRRARLRDLGRQYDRAARAEDTGRVRTLLRQGSRLVEALRATAVEAARRPALARELAALRSEVATRLTRIDPAAGRLLERHDVLGTRLATSVLGLR